MFRSEHARWIEAATVIDSLRAIAVEARLLQGQSQTREIAATSALLRGDIAGTRASAMRGIYSNERCQIVNYRAMALRRARLQRRSDQRGLPQR